MCPPSLHKHHFPGDHISACLDAINEYAAGQAACIEGTTKAGGAKIFAVRPNRFKTFAFVPVSGIRSIDIGDMDEVSVQIGGVSHSLELIPCFNLIRILLCTRSAGKPGD